MLEGRHYQNAYVTRDLDRAVAKIRSLATVRQEMTFEPQIEISTPDGPGLLHNRIALLWVEDLQYELIQPIGGVAHLYTQAMPHEGLLGFHHTASRIADWDAFRSRLPDYGYPLVFEGEAGPMRFLYVDARATLGHFLEFTTMPDEMWAATGGR